MSGELVAFWVLAAGAVAGALCVVLPPFGRNPLHAAIALLATLACVAGVFVLLSAHLVAVLQVLVYVGAVMVLFTFVVLLLNLRREEFIGARVTPYKVAGVAAAAFIGVKVLAALVAAGAGTQAVDLTNPGLADFGGIRDVGRELVTTYLFPFELTSLLLLVAILGAVLIARRDRASSRAVSRQDGGAAA